MVFTFEEEMQILWLCDKIGIPNKEWLAHFAAHELRAGENLIVGLQRYYVNLIK